MSTYRIFITHNKPRTNFPRSESDGFTIRVTNRTGRHQFPFAICYPNCNSSVGPNFNLRIVPHATSSSDADAYTNRHTDVHSGRDNANLNHYADDEPHRLAPAAPGLPTAIRVDCSGQRGQ